MSMVFIRKYILICMTSKLDGQTNQFLNVISM